MDIRVDERLVVDCNSCFTIPFGLKVDDHKVSLGSAEEIQGKVLCQVLIKVTVVSPKVAIEPKKPTPKR
jgi:hypothetical protein